MELFKKLFDKRSKEKNIENLVSIKKEDLVQSQKEEYTQQPIDKKYIFNSTVAKIGSKIIGFEDESVDELELPDGSTLWAKNYYRGKWADQKEENRTEYIHIDLYNYAEITTKYGKFTFKDYLVVENGVVTQGRLCAGNTLRIMTPVAELSFSGDVTFYKNGNVKEGSLEYDVKINDKLYTKGSNLKFCEDGSTYHFIFNHEEVNLNLPDKNEEELFVAIKNGDLARVKEIIEILNGLNCTITSIKDKEKNPPFNNAINNGFIDIAEYLLSNGFDVDSEDCHAETALITHSKTGKKELVKWLLDNKANMNAVNFDGEVPLIIATLRNNKDVIELLLENGANVNVTKSDGFTPLNIASKKRYVNRTSIDFDRDTVSLLLNKGADVNIKSNSGETPLKRICNNPNCADLVSRMISMGADVNAADDSGYTPLHTACQKGNIEIAKILIENGCNINTTNKDGDSALSLSLNQNNIEVVKMLVEKGADISSLPKGTTLDFGDNKS